MGLDKATCKTLYQEERDAKPASVTADQPPAIAPPPQPASVEENWQTEEQTEDLLSTFRRAANNRRLDNFERRVRSAFLHDEDPSEQRKLKRQLEGWVRTKPDGKHGGAIPSARALYAHLFGHAELDRLDAQAEEAEATTHIAMVRGLFAPSLQSGLGHRLGPKHQFQDATGRLHCKPETSMRGTPCRVELLLRSMACLGGDWPEVPLEFVAVSHAKPNLGVKRPSDGDVVPGRCVFTRGVWIQKGDDQARAFWWGDLPPNTACEVAIRLEAHTFQPGRPRSSEPEILLGTFTVRFSYDGEVLESVVDVGPHTHLEGWDMYEEHPSPSRSGKTLRMVMDGAAILGIELQIRDRDLLNPNSGRGQCVRWEPGRSEAPARGVRSEPGTKSLGQALLGNLLDGWKKG